MFSFGKLAAPPSGATKVMFCREWHPWNALSLISVTPPPMVSSVIPVHPWNALLPIDCTESPILTVSIFVQFLKTLSPISCKESS